MYYDINNMDNIDWVVVGLAVFALIVFMLFWIIQHKREMSWRPPPISRVPSP
jgi:hypothetical protein